MTLTEGNSSQDTWMTNTSRGNSFDDTWMTNTSRGNSLSCMLEPQLPLDYNITHATMEGVRLIVYKISFDQYKTNPLETLPSKYYKTSTWYRVTRMYGQTLLLLPFNYQILSLDSLSHGVEEFSVILLDHPAGCFMDRSDRDKRSMIERLIINDFKPSAPGFLDSSYSKEINQVCHQEISKEKTKLGQISLVCCDLHHHCDDKPVTNKWIELITLMLHLVRWYCLLFGPVHLIGSIKGMSSLPNHLQ